MISFATIVIRFFFLQISKRMPNSRIFFRSAIILITRMHSSRMRTSRSLTACLSLLPGWVGGGGMSGPGGGGDVCSGAGGQGIPACTEADHPPPPPLTESQTPVKTLPWPNLVAAGNKNEIIQKSTFSSVCV